MNCKDKSNRGQSKVGHFSFAGEEHIRSKKKRSQHAIHLRFTIYDLRFTIYDLRFTIIGIP